MEHNLKLVPLQKVNGDARKIAIELAKKECFDNSYSPYSKFRVGACVVADNGCFFGGCNIESAAYSPTICGERSAITNMIVNSNPRPKILVIFIYTDTLHLTAPCGVCRQFIYEFATKDTIITTVNKNYEEKSWTIQELLPDAFGPEDLKK